VSQPASFNTLDEWLPWLETLSPREIVLGLERVQAVLEVLKLPRPDLVINVAGTNGKGSSVAMLEAILSNAGRKTGCYTSPHVMRYNERIRIARQPADDALIIQSLERVQAARGDVPLTFFEFGTLAALVAFADAGADTLILEVGMGGRLDAVNAIEPDACLITNIALDHTAWLGSDRESIAREKAGIMRPAKPVVFGSPDCPRAIDSCASELAAHLRKADVDFSYRSESAVTSGWTWVGRDRTLSGLARPALAGEVQLQNASAVLALLEAADLQDLLTSANINAAFGALSLDGRFQVIGSQPTFVLDVAHNPAAAKELSDSLAQLPARGQTTAIIGMFADKDVEGVVAALSATVDTWIAVTVPGSRAATATDLAQRIANVEQRSCLIINDIEEALSRVVERSAPDDLVLVTGSFYLVGPALLWLQSK
jgi:dihydrofolate synthase/folylpolyglutamate synthase